MPDIIDIDLKSPFFKPNHAYFIDLMEKDDVEIILHSREEILFWRQAIDYRKKSVIIEKIDKKAWKLKLIKNKPENKSNFFTPKIQLLKQGEVIYVLNRGQGLLIIQEYKKLYLQESRKFKMKRDDEGKWRIWLEES